VIPFVSATIDTGALRHNLAVVRARAPGARVMAVIKANAYGHGLVTVARALDTADSFAVARVDEGLALRAAGITKPVVLLEGVFERDQLEAAAAAGFELVVHVGAQVELLRQAPPGPPLVVWLKLDSGMNRLGFKGADFQAAHEVLSALPAVARPLRLMTHFANADLPTEPSTAAQLERFRLQTAALGGERVWPPVVGCVVLVALAAAVSPLDRLAELIAVLAVSATLAVLAERDGRRRATA